MFSDGELASILGLSSPVGVRASVAWGAVSRQLRGARWGGEPAGLLLLGSRRGLAWHGGGRASQVCWTLSGRGGVSPARRPRGGKGRAFLLCSALQRLLLLNSGAGFPSVSVGKSPMVEQAVQTGSLDNLNAKKLFPSKGPAGTQLSGRAAPPSSKTASGTECPLPWGLLRVLDVAHCFRGSFFI